MSMDSHTTYFYTRHVLGASRSKLQGILKNIQRELKITKRLLGQAKLDGDMVLVKGYEKRYKQATLLLDRILSKVGQDMNAEEEDEDEH